MEKWFLKMKYTEIPTFLELRVKRPFWELLHTFLQVIQKDNFAQK